MGFLGFRRWPRPVGVAGAGRPTQPSRPLSGIFAHAFPQLAPRGGANSIPLNSIPLNLAGPGGPPVASSAKPPEGPGLVAHPLAQRGVPKRPLRASAHPRVPNSPESTVGDAFEWQNTVFAAFGRALRRCVRIDARLGYLTRLQVSPGAGSPQSERKTTPDPVCRVGKTRTLGTGGACSTALPRAVVPV